MQRYISFDFVLEFKHLLLSQPQETQSSRILTLCPIKDFCVVFSSMRNKVKILSFEITMVMFGSQEIPRKEKKNVKENHFLIFGFTMNH